MAASSSSQISNSFSRYWPWFFFAAAFESLCAVLVLLSVPSESGLSFPRLVLLGILSLIIFAGIFLGMRARHDLTRFDTLANTRSLIFATFLFLTSSLALFLLRYLNPEKLLPYYERMSPLLWVALVISAQTILFFSLVKYGFHRSALARYQLLQRPALIAFVILFFIFLFVAITKIGIKPDSAYWGEPGVAIQGWQFITAILAGVLTSVYFIKPSRITNIFIPLAVYMVACILWLSVSNDVLTSSFYAPIDPPLEMPLPYSDAGFYDYLSQSLLIGTDYLGRIPPRPFYVLFLAVLHYFFGQNYAAMIAAQTLVLAFFPVCLYFLAKRLHSPAAGVTVALFAIFRELTSLWISSDTRVANSKMFTTDFPTAMAIAFTCLVFLWWFEKRDFKSTLIAGGAFGLLLLFRTQSLFILPVVLMVAWFVYQRKTQIWFFACVIFFTAMLAALIPWLVHNYTVSGAFSFDDPKQVAIIYSQYSTTGNLDISQFDPEKDSVRERIISFTLQNPGVVARFIATHILNTEIGGLLSLPLIKPFESLMAPVNLYWVSWDGTLEWYNLTLLILYLAMIAIGLGVSWRRMGWLGLLPLAFNLGYTLANGISRFSSWRYNLPIDWVVYFYFGLGVLELFSFIVALFGRERSSADILQSAPKEMTVRDVRPHYVGLLAIFAFIGALPWLAKGYVQPRYTSTQAELIARMDTAGYPEADTKSFLTRPNAILMEGLMLYPRMYQRNEGFASANPWPAYAIREFPRMGFLVLNQDRNDVIFMTRDLQQFPQGQDVIILGCQRDDYIEAYLVDFDGKVFESSPLSQACN